MKIEKNLIFLVLYYGFLRYLPESNAILVGKLCRKLRYLCCRRLFKYCGKNVNIERRAFFGRGNQLEIGDESGLGVNCVVSNDIVIGKNVMMGPNCYILSRNHEFNRIDIPMIEQNYAPAKKTIIEDDVWIGRNVTLTPGRTLRRGTIVAIGSVMTKDFPEYSIIGGNPAKLIRSRK